MRVFTIIWFGQMVSLIGSGLTSFALSVWVYKNTNSVTQFALISVCTMLPNIIVSPLAGTLGDFWDRRWLMILSNCGSGLSILSIALLLFTGHLDIWYIYVACAASSAFSALQWPAYNATITLLVPPQHLFRASSMAQLGLSVSQLISPVVGGILLATIQIQGVLLLDGVTFIFCLIMLLLVRIPKLAATTKAKGLENSLWRDVLGGWTYIRTRPGLFQLLILFFAYNFMEGTAIVLCTPLFLSFTSPAVLGTMLSISGSGMLVGTMFFSSWGGRKRPIHNIFMFMVLSGFCMLLAGLRPNVMLCTVAAFFHFFSLPILFTSKQVIFQSKVVPNVQARVFAMNLMLVNSSLLLAYLVAGPLSDKVFNPLLVINGSLAGSVGKIIGVGAGRGIGLLFIVMGMLMMIITLRSYLSPRLRLLESELPDVISH